MKQNLFGSEMANVTTRFCRIRAAISLHRVFLFFVRCVESSTVISVLSRFVKVGHCYHLALGTYTIGRHLHTIKCDERVHMR